MVTTHRHGDHWQALAQVVATTGARTYAHADDAPAIPVETDVFLADGDTLLVGDVPLQVIHLPGHTPGGLALVYDDPDGFPHVFTGDSLFPGGVGKTTDETFPQLLDAVSTQALRSAAGRDVGLPGPRQGHDTGRRAPPAGRLARPRLVAGQSVVVTIAPSAASTKR